MYRNRPALLPTVFTMFFASICSVALAGFTQVNCGLTNVYGSIAVWGDYDNDGDLDVLIAGRNSTDYSNPDLRTRLFRNDSGTFQEVTTNLIGIEGAAAWGDYDNDGDLDLALAGATGRDSSTSRIYRNDGSIFTDIGAPLTGVSFPSLAWGDYDNDGDLDLVISGDNGPYGSTLIYRNDSGSFTRAWPIGYILSMCCNPDVAWGDYDDDGDLDLAASGYIDTKGYQSIIYRNDGGTFADINASLMANVNSLAWGDYDNDGDLDLGIMGKGILMIYGNQNGTFTGSGAGTLILDLYDGTERLEWGDYDNDGDLDIVVSGRNIQEKDSCAICVNDNGSFTVLPSFTGRGRCAWGDYDNDGDLDLLIAVAYDGISGNTGSYILRNDDVPSNRSPSSPTGLAASIVGNEVRFSWNASSDDRTLPAALSYSVRVGTTPGSGNILSGTSNPATGARLIPGMGNAQQGLTHELKGLPNGKYYWSVQAVDSAFVASAWAPEQTFVVDARRISGYAKDSNGAGVFDVRIATDEGEESVGTDYDGYYELWVTNGWSGIVNASKTGYTIEPASHTYNNVTADLQDQNYTACIYFSDIPLDLTGVCRGSLAWGDYDSDGDLDLAAAGAVEDSLDELNPVSKIYRNDGGTFVDAGAKLTGVYACSLDWGDYDSDGDLDLALMGNTNPSRLWGSNNVTKVYRNDAGVFTDIGATMVGLSRGAVAWGDYDNDGDLDLATTGSRGGEMDIAPCTIIYRNDHGTFRDSGIQLEAVESSSFAWGDYDNDGDLDIAIAGFAGPGYVYHTKIYRNDAGSFADINAEIPGIWQGSLAWVDYDDDGDLDLSVMGSYKTYDPDTHYVTDNPVTSLSRNDGGAFTATTISLPGITIPRTTSWGDYDDDGDADFIIAGDFYLGNGWWTYDIKLFQNDGGAFVDAEAILPNLYYVSFAWGDCDGDKDLDLALSGATGLPAFLKIYRNNWKNPNTAPSTVSGLSATADGRNMTFTWIAGSDAETPVAGLTYNLRVGTKPGTDDVFSGMASILNGTRRVAGMGNVQKNLSWTLKGLEPDAYYWSVQAVDSSFIGSAWAVEKMVVGDMNIAKMKSKPDGSAVKCNSAVVTAVFGDIFYVEEPDRSAGMRVDTQVQDVSAGDVIDLSGEMQTDVTTGERFVSPSSVEKIGVSKTAPLGLAGAALGGGASGLQGGIAGAGGVNNIGLYVRVWGRVGERGSDYIYVDDGSGIKDGTMTDTAPNVGVKVSCDPTGYDKGDYLVVTGISSCFKIGTSLYRRVLATDILDLD